MDVKKKNKFTLSITAKQTERYLGEYQNINSNSLSLSDHSDIYKSTSPNPTSYEITLIGIEDESQVFLINTLGEKQKLSEVSNSHHYNISDFAPGIYQIVITQNNQHNLVKRLVIQ